MLCFSSVVCQCAADIERLNDEHVHEKQALAEDDDEDVEEDEEEGIGKFTVYDKHEWPSQIYIQLYILLCNL